MTTKEIELKDRIMDKMIEILKSRALDNPINVSLVHDYGRLYEIKYNLMEDIENRGVSVPYRETADGEILKKKNDCIPELNKVIGQMSKITYDLGIRACDMKIEDAPIDL